MTTNLQPVVPLKDLKVNYYKKKITIRGCIIRVNKSCQIPSTLVLLCKKCDKSITVYQKNGIYSFPHKKCKECGAMKFEPDLSSPYVETVPLQIIRIQEHFGEDQDDQGRMPRVMDIELYNDLVDTCMPGDDVTVSGLIKMQGTDNGQKLKVNTSTNLYMEASSIINNNSKAKNKSGLSIEFDTKDYKSIKNIHKNSNTLAILVHSLCPGIYGHEMIKMALLLSLFGGSPKHSNFRENIHVLVVGDPGLGKSQMLQACARVAPKGIYVSGNSSTSSGLTVTLIKESGQNDFALEPGALVLADRGCCCIDEFDKMSTQHQALLEAMEQQSVSVAKSGVIWSLPSRTSILAAANPLGGCYDESKLLSKNLNMSQPLLSRFDMIFLLVDRPFKDLDNFLAGHVMLVHKGNEQTKQKNFFRSSEENSNQVISLKRRLETVNNCQSVSSSILRKYISYAREYVKPSLSKASASILQKFYLELRKRTKATVNLSTCSRQLEALIRLTEARAKLDLREETTEEDAYEVIELMQHTVYNLGNDEIQNQDLKNDRSTNSSIKKFFKLLMLDAENSRRYLYSKEELNKLGAKYNIKEDNVYYIINKLNEQGFLIKQINDLYKFVPP